MSRKNIPKGAPRDWVNNAFYKLKNSPRWEILRRAKAKLQASYEYLDLKKNCVTGQKRQPSDFDRWLPAIEMLMCTPFLTENEIMTQLAKLNGVFTEEEALIVAKPPWDGSLWNKQPEGGVNLVQEANKFEKED